LLRGTAAFGELETTSSIFISSDKISVNKSKTVMAKCEHCGNEYKTFEVTRGGKTHVFESFECAIQKMAPQCNHCGAKLLATAWKTAAGFSAAPTARAKAAKAGCVIASEPASNLASNQPAPRRRVFTD
jgi:hypothetical protein